MTKFIRQDFWRHSKLGKRRRKLIKWRRPKGRHSKMRKQRKSYPKSPTVGYKTPRKEHGKIKNLSPILISNASDVKKAGKHNIIILSATLGARKKLEIIKMADEKQLRILNVSKGEKK